MDGEWFEPDFSLLEWKGEEQVVSTARRGVQDELELKTSVRTHA